MLRMLACDPGADRRQDRRPHDGGDHPVPGAIQPVASTIDALRSLLCLSSSPTASGVSTPGTPVIEAFVAAHAVHIPGGPAPSNASGQRLLRVQPPEPRRPCRGTVASRLLRHPELPIHHDNAPCESGNEAACAIVVTTIHNDACGSVSTSSRTSPGRSTSMTRGGSGSARTVTCSARITNARADDEVTFEVFEHEESDAEEEDPDLVQHPAERGDPGVVAARDRAGGLGRSGGRARRAGPTRRSDGTPLFRVRHADSGVWTSGCHGPGWLLHGSWSAPSERVLGSQSVASRSDFGARTAPTSSRSR